MRTNPTSLQDPLQDLPRQDVVIVGGGAAGLSAALTLARSRRSVLVVDGGRPRNSPTDGVHGFLTRDGTDPMALLEIGRAEVRGYGGTIIDGVAVAAGGNAGRFTVELGDGREVVARRILVATGLTDELPAIPGLEERWGKDVVHCPYCHGWEFRDQAIAVLSTSSVTVHQALLFRQLSPDVTVLTHTGPPLTAEQVADLTARDIGIVAGSVTGLETAGDVLVGARLADGTLVPCRALVVRPGFTARSGVLESLGLAATPAGAGNDLAFATDPTGSTAIPGVWAAGNVADPMLNVVGAAAAGSFVGAAINGDLVAADLAADLAQGRRPQDHEAERYWDDRYQGHDHTHDRDPNPTLVEAAADLAPGTALDLGCGGGTDAIWLAQRGWRVTAVDISRSALDQGARRAAVAGVADRIEWRHHDLATTFPPGDYDLVTAHYVHTPAGAPSERMGQAAARAVAPGGTLLLVGHATPPPSSPDPDVDLPTPAEVLASLDLDGEHWQVVTSEVRERRATGPDGEPAVLTESIVETRRLP